MCLCRQSRDTCTRNDCAQDPASGQTADAMARTSAGSSYLVAKYSAATVPVLMTPPLQWISTFSPAALASSNTLSVFSAVSGADSGAITTLSLSNPPACSWSRSGVLRFEQSVSDYVRNTPALPRCLDFVRDAEAQARTCCSILAWKRKSAVEAAPVT